MITKIALYVAVIVFVGLSVCHEILAFRIGQTPPYVGVIIDKTTSGGRYNDHYLYVDFGKNAGLQPLSVHPIDYKRYMVGQRWGTKPFSYIPLLGVREHLHALPPTDFPWFLRFFGWFKGTVLMFSVVIGLPCLFSKEN